MGYFLQEHDIYVGTMLDELNLRFAPGQGGKEHLGGIQEMAALQAEFELFKSGRSFGTSARTLHLGGSANHVVKNRFYRYLDNLRRQKSNLAGMNGEAAIIDALVRNLALKKPLPVYFDFHDMRLAATPGVVVTEKGRPLPYMDLDYLWISLPMQPREDQPAAAKKKKK